MKTHVFFLFLATTLFLAPLAAQYYNDDESMPGLNPNHAENLYDHLLHEQGDQTPRPQPGTGSNDDYDDNQYNEYPQ